MNITIRNCNNIDNARISIVEGRLNIKYATNGTGKSSIARAIYCSAGGNCDGLNDLLPYKYFNNAVPENIPFVDGVTPDMNVAIFDEKYLEQFVFMEDELVKNSFDIFIKTQNYEQQMEEINGLIRGINDRFDNDPELNSMISDMDEFILAFGNAKSGISGNSVIAKGLKNGNVIQHIPEGLEAYSIFLKDEQNSKWLRWQSDGRKYMELGDRCPFCASELAPQREIIDRIGEEYDSKTIEHLSSILSLVERLGAYLTEETRQSVQIITTSVRGISEEQTQYLIQLKDTIVLFQKKLRQLQSLDFFSLKNADQLTNIIDEYLIDLQFFPCLNTEYTQTKVQPINKLIEVLKTNIGNLQRLVNCQKQEIENTVRRYCLEINNFLQIAGYSYVVSLEETNDHEYKLKLKYSVDDIDIPSARTRLSYGERNAFALVLFMYSAIHNQSNFIILDDPISSFDQNKKFAILYMLFIRGNSFRGKTVLLLTHDLEPIIDSIYNHPDFFQGTPAAYFLENTNGQLSEQLITKDDIFSSVALARLNVQSSTNEICKLINLRRYIEMTEGKNNTWQLISNILHKRDIPTFGDQDTPMNDEDILSATEVIKHDIPEFNYNDMIEVVTNRELMIQYYYESQNRYEKLQIYRLIFDKQDESLVIRNFINQTYHIENDYLFQLNSNTFSTIPTYIITVCDEALQSLTKN